MELDELTHEIIGAAMKVHTALGPGLLEGAYEACLLHELHKRKMEAVSQMLLPVQYDGVDVDAGYRIDLLVEDAVIVEVKAVQQLAPIHQAQLLSHLKMSGKKLGLLINFNVEHLRDGIKRMAN